MIENILALADSIEDEVIEYRRELHQIPEIAYKTEKTAGYVEEKLRSFGIEDIKTGLGNATHYGITADIHGSEPGKMIALRADMDALPVTEQTGLSFASTHSGWMHACGHDGHTAMLLCAARLLQEHRKEFAGTVRLIFQPSEETPPPAGSFEMVEAGVLEGVQAIFGIHMQPMEPTGVIGFNMTMAGSALDCFKIELIGKGGHGSMPQKSVDAITLSAQVINNIQYIISRQSDPLEPLVITIGTIEGGTLWNIIAETVKMTGTMRSYNQRVREKAIADLEQVIKTACENVGATYKFENDPAVNPLVNHQCASMLLKEALEKTIGPERVKIMPQPSTATEDFANYLFKVPGTFMWLGCCSGEDSAYPLHHPKFNMDEKALKTGVAAHLSIVNEYLNTDAQLEFGK